MTISSNFRRESAPEIARDLAERITAQGITIPADVAELLTRLDELDENRPPMPAEREVAAAFADGDFEAAERLAQDVVAANVRSAAWRDARLTVGMRALSAWTANGNDITTQLAKRAAPLIEKLNMAAAIETRDTAALIRSGRASDAEVIARLDIYAGDLTALYDLRRQVTRHANYGQEAGHNCGMWRDPRKVVATGHLAARPAVDRLLDGIRADAGLWFPLPEQAAARAREIAAEEAAERQAEEREAIRARGGRVA